MTSRSRLRFALIAALSLVPFTGQAADTTAQQAQSTPNVISPTTRRASAVAAPYTIACEDWRQSHPQVPVDLRFRKPNLPTSSPSKNKPSTGTASLSPLSRPADTTAGPATPYIATKRIGALHGALVESPSGPARLLSRRPAITVISDAENDRQRAAAAVARLKQLIEQPKAEAATPTSYEQAVTMQPADVQPVAMPSVDGPSNGAIRSTVDQLRFMARRLTGSARPPRPRVHKDWR